MPVTEKKLGVAATESERRRYQDLLRRTYIDYQQTSEFLANPIVMHRAEGLFYWDVDGKTYFDGIGGIFALTVAPEKGAKMAGRKGPAVRLRYGLFKRRAEPTSARSLRSVAVRQLELPCGNRTICYYRSSNCRAERDHQIIISEMLTRVKRNIRNDVIFL